MIDHGKEAGRHQMRVLQHAREVMHRHHGHVGLDQQVGPFGGGAGLENTREFGIDGVDIDGAAGERRKFWVAAQVITSVCRKEILPLLFLGRFDLTPHICYLS